MKPYPILLAALVACHSLESPHPLATPSSSEPFESSSALGDPGQKAPHTAGARSVRSADRPRHTIVFAHHVDESRRDYDIWQVCADGSQLASLVTMPDRQSQVAVAPDGRHLFFTSPVDGQNDIWMRPYHRGEPVNLTEHPARDQSMSLSPDGERMAFFSDRDGQDPELYVMEIATREVKRWTDNDVYDTLGDWSPDGERFVFTRFFPGEAGKGDGQGALIELEWATGEERELFRGPSFPGSPDYSPDGSRIAFHYGVGDVCDLWLLDRASGEARPLMETYLDEYSPDWSPDGGWIVYTAGRGSDSQGTFDLWIVRADGNDAQIVSTAANTQMEPSWRPGESLCR